MEWKKNRCIHKIIRLKLSDPFESCYNAAYNAIELFKLITLFYFKTHNDIIKHNNCFEIFTILLIMKNKYSDSVFSRNTPESDYYLKSSWVWDDRIFTFHQKVRVPLRFDSISVKRHFLVSLKVD